MFVDPDDVVLYGPDCSIALLTEEGVLVVPPDEGGLAGMAARNIASLVPQVRACALRVARAVHVACCVWLAGAVLECSAGAGWLAVCARPA